MNIRFQGIIKATGPDEKTVDKAMVPHLKNNGTYIRNSVSEFTTDTYAWRTDISPRLLEMAKSMGAELPKDKKSGFKHTLTSEDNIAFWKGLGVDIRFKIKPTLFNLLFRQKAIMADMNDVMSKQNQVIVQLGQSEYKRRFNAYLDEHPEFDITGKPVVNIEVKDDGTSVTK